MVAYGSVLQGESSSLSPASKMLGVADRVAEEELRANGGTMIPDSDEGNLRVHCGYHSHLVRFQFHAGFGFTCS